MKGRSRKRRREPRRRTSGAGSRANFWFRFKPAIDRKPSGGGTADRYEAARLCIAYLMAWSQRFNDPITLPNGRTLRALREAGNYIAGLPRAEQDAPQWRTATEVLLLVAERGGDPMLTRIGIMRALNAGKAKRRERRRKWRRSTGSLGEMR